MCAPWPGNVRQLRDVVRAGAIWAAGEPAVGIEHLEIDETPVTRLAACHTPQEKMALVADALHRSGGNKSDAARRIRASRRTVIRYASQLAGMHGAEPGPAHERLAPR